MSTAKHPPGPWRWEGYALVAADDSSILFAEEIGPRVPLHCTKEELATAEAEGKSIERLIAAAPGLLAALRAAERFMAGFEDDALQEDGFPETLTEVRAALAAVDA